MNRQQMFDAVLEDLNRKDKENMLPGWLESATARANEFLRVDDMVFRALLEVTQNIIRLPPDFIDFFSMSVRDATGSPTGPDGTRSLFVYMPPEQFDAGMDDPKPYRAPRAPLFYTKRGSYLEIGDWNIPKPYKLDLWFYRAMGVPQAATDTNWLMMKYPHVFKNIMLHFGYNHLQEFDVAGALMQSAIQEMQALNDMSAATRYGSGPLIARAPKKLGGRRS